jgi:hypothetical protein
MNDYATAHQYIAFADPREQDAFDSLIAVERALLLAGLHAERAGYGNEVHSSIDAAMREVGHALATVRGET